MSRYGDNTKKEFISEELETISWHIYDKEFYDLTPEEANELVGVILSILADNMLGYDQNFKEPVLKERE